MFDDDHVLRGPDIPEPLGNESLGPFCFNSLKQIPEDVILLTEAETGKTCTTRELLQQGVNAAAAICNLGIESGDIICLVGGNTIIINTIGFGALLAGVVWAPLDPSLKSFEYQHLIKLFQPKLLVCDSAIIPVFKDAIDACEIDIQIFSLQEADDDTRTWENLLVDIGDIAIEDFQPIQIADLDEMAILACSSGSTGLPKGVELTHRNWLFQIFLGRGIMSTMGTILVAHTSHFFWVSGLYLYFLTLGLGARRLLINDVSPEIVMEAIQKHKTGWGLFAPSVISGIVHHPNVKDFDLTSMTAIVTAGSPLNKGTYLLAMEMFGEDLFIAQAYGLSEVSGSYSLIKRGLDPLSVGCINYGTAIKIVDRETGENLPPGGEGEMLISSLGLMKGYFNNPKATAEAVDEERWMHTGDVGYVTPDGVIYITGRIKELMKLDNHQISPAEIEEVIRLVPGVSDVAVAGISISADNSYPMALVVKEEESDVSEEDIIKCVNDNLSEFKQLRGGVCFVEKIPRTMTGKIKRADLQVLADELYMGDTPTIL